MNKINRIVMIVTREWEDYEAIEAGLLKATKEFPDLSEPVQLVHGYDWAPGHEAETVWQRWVDAHPTLYVESEIHPRSRFNSDYQRDMHMIKLGTDLMITFILPTVRPRPLSCQHAREMGVKVIDFGAET